MHKGPAVAALQCWPLPLTPPCCTCWKYFYSFQKWFNWLERSKIFHTLHGSGFVMPTKYTYTVVDEVATVVTEPRTKNLGLICWWRPRVTKLTTEILNLGMLRVQRKASTHPYHVFAWKHYIPAWLISLMTLFTPEVMSSLPLLPHFLQAFLPSLPLSINQS